MGYCIIAAMGERITMREMDVLKLNREDDNHERLQVIYLKVAELIKSHQPDCFAIEAPFFGRNVQSMLKLGRAQGVAIAAAIGAGLPVCEYSPKKIKQSITGNGNADKEQVWKMLQQILELSGVKLSHYDASDAAAVAVCHYYQDRNPMLKTRGKKNSWKEYLAGNPERIAR